MNKKILNLTIVTVIAITLVSTVFGISTWNQTISWDISIKTDFKVYDSLIGGVEIVSDTPLSLGTDPTLPYTKTYYIQNDGNVKIRVTGLVTVVTGTATYAWIPSIGYVDVLVGTTRVAITLNLTSLSVGIGSLTVTFNSAIAPP